MRFSLACRIALVIGVSACAGESPLPPGVFVMDDVGTGSWTSVTTGASHTCAIDRDGRAFCWGNNASFQLGVDQTVSTCGALAESCSLVPVPVTTGRTFRRISAGRAHTCAIATDSVPYCWGSNSDGQLGGVGPASAVLRIPGNAAMISISAGSTHSCGVRADNVLLCWGSNRSGAVGASVGSGVPPTVIAGSQRFTEVEASDNRTCARTVGGRVMCWGQLWNQSSNDSTNDFTIRGSPVLVAELGAMTSMDVGSTSSCSVDGSGFLWCWESNLNGESGTGPGPGSVTPRRVASDEEFASVTVGNGHACAVTTDGTGYCWGSNRLFQIGSLTAEYCGSRRVPCATLPTRISGRQRFISLSAGLGGHVCGVTDQYNLYCWGAGAFGQRGDGSTTGVSRVPRLAVGVHGQ